MLDDVYPLPHPGMRQRCWTSTGRSGGASPMTRRLKRRIDPEQSPCACMLPEHKPVRRGREIIDQLAVEAPKPKPAKIQGGVVRGSDRAVVKRMRSSGSAPTEVRSVVPDGRYEPEAVAGDRHVADGRERQVSGHQLLAARRKLLQETDPDAG